MNRVLGPYLTDGFPALNSTAAFFVVVVFVQLELIQYASVFPS